MKVKKTCLPITLENKEFFIFFFLQFVKLTRFKILTDLSLNTSLSGFNVNILEIQLSLCFVFKRMFPQEKAFTTLTNLF